VPRFIVDRDLLGLPQEARVEQRRCLHQAALRASSGGPPVRYLRCTFIPTQDRCLDLFEADTPELVRQVIDIAQVPYRWIGEVSEDAAPGTTA
jgi:hypothetical protein